MDKRIKGFLLRGLAAGATGGAASALFLRFVTETQIGYALRFEDAQRVGLPAGVPAAFSRATQRWGGIAAAVIYGIVLGVVLSIVVAALHHRISGRNEFERASKVAAAAFVALVLIPSLKYPPNPPTVGNPDTISQRTTHFMLLMGASTVVVFAAWYLWSRLSERGWDGAPRFFVGGGALVVMVVALFVLWPASPDPINPPDNEAAPALQIASNAPPDVLARVLQTARTARDQSLRDPNNPEKPLDLSAIDKPADLAGSPVALSTSKLVPHGYTTVIWHFRLQSIGGLAILWAVIAGVFGLLSDLPAGAMRISRARASVDALPGTG